MCFKIYSRSNGKRDWMHADLHPSRMSAPGEKKTVKMYFTSWLSALHQQHSGQSEPLSRHLKMAAAWNSWAPRWGPWPSKAGPGIRMRTSRSMACLPPNPHLVLISSPEYLPANLSLMFLLSPNRLVWIKSVKMLPSDAGARSRCAPFDQWYASAGQDSLMNCGNYQSTWRR